MRQGQGKVITMSRPVQDNVRESSWKGQGKVKERISKGKSKVKERSRQGREARAKTVIALKLQQISLNIIGF